MKPALAFAATVPLRGYQPAWTSGCRCPGCKLSNWHVGRTLAECAFCATALPLAAAQPPAGAGGDLIPFRRAPCTTAPEAPAASPLAAGAFDPEGG